MSMFDELRQVHAVGPRTEQEAAAHRYMIWPEGWNVDGRYRLTLSELLPKEQTVGARGEPL